jgi:hypothetical protein
MINVGKQNQEIIEKFYEDNKDSVIELSPKEIGLRDDIHIKGARTTRFNKDLGYALRAFREKQLELNKTIIVRKLSNKGYVLVSGLKWYRLAQLLNVNIKCIVVDSKLSHCNFEKNIGIIQKHTKQPKDTEYFLNYKDLVILDIMKIRQPKREKKLAKFDIFGNNKGVESAITVRQRPDGKYALVDGYISYLWLKEQKEKWIPVKVV